jgi:hypothetical protein
MISLSSCLHQSLYRVTIDRQRYFESCSNSPSEIVIFFALLINIARALVKLPIVTFWNVTWPLIIHKLTEREKKKKKYKTHWYQR